MEAVDKVDSSSPLAAQAGEANELLEEYRKQENEEKFWPEDAALKTFFPGCHSFTFSCIGFQ